MKRLLFVALLLIPGVAQAQALIDRWRAEDHSVAMYANWVNFANSMGGLRRSDHCSLADKADMVVSNLEQIITDRYYYIAGAPNIDLTDEDLKDFERELKQWERRLRQHERRCR